MKSGIKIVKLLQTKGYQAYFVGGMVRDMLLNRTSDNIDIATDATPDEVERILKKAGYKPKEVGKKFGTILVIDNSMVVEITTFRAEGRYSDNRHPDQVRFIKDYKEDAKRRDFTINALYFDPITKQTFDPTNGIKDIGLKILRFVGDPKKRIDEDGLRMMRGVRLATQLGFKLEKNSFAAIKTRAKYIQGISGERIKAELDKILLSENRVVGLELLDKTGLLRFIIPEMESLKKFTHRSKIYHQEGDMFIHTLLALKNTPSSNLDLLYAILFHDISKPQRAIKKLKAEGWVLSTPGHADASAEIFLKFSVRLKFPRKNTKTIEWLIRKHGLSSSFFEMRPVKQFRIASQPSFELLMQHWYADHHGNERIEGGVEHTRQFKKSMAAGKKMLKQIQANQDLFRQLADGKLVMKYSKLKPGVELGRKIEDVKIQIILGKIKNEKDIFITGKIRHKNK